MDSIGRTPEPPSSYDDCWVGYLDILGYGDWVNEMEAAGTALDSIRNLREATKVLPPPGGTTYKDDYWVYAYSDSIILCLCPRQRPAPPWQILWHAATICYRMPKDVGLFVRGAITWGKFHGDDRVVFSPALVGAVRCEEGKAKWPRVLVDDIIVQHALSAEITGVSLSAPLLLRDEDDGNWFLNYLAWDVALRENDRDKADAWLDAHGEIIIARLHKHQEDDRVRPKYEWLREYHNRYCRDYVPSSAGRRLMIP